MKRLNGKLQTEKFLTRAIPLLKEYTEKFDRIHSELKECREKQGKGMAVEKQHLAQIVSRMAPPGATLARFISEQIEHAALDELAQIELRLRLAEFESAIRVAEESVNF